MCWAIPVQIDAINGGQGTVELSGTSREVGLELIDDPQKGDWVLVHAGFAIQKLDEEEAQERLQLWDEMAQAGKDM